MKQQKVTARRLNDWIRKILRVEGHYIRATFTDPRKTGWRVKFWMNDALDKRVLRIVRDLLKAWGLSKTHKVQMHHGLTGYAWPGRVCTSLILHIQR